jgi:phenylacetate-CoA ligase
MTLSESPMSRQIDTMYTSVYERVLLPTWERALRGRPTLAYLAHLDATQWLPAEAIEKAQLDSLRTLLVHAEANVPYYRETFAKIGFDARGVRSRDDLSALPLLTKDIIRERYDDLIDPAHRGENIRKGTSGSTGAPLKFEYSRESEYWRQATRVRGYAWSGYRAGMPAFFYWAGSQPPPRGAKKLKIDLDRALRRETYVDPLRQDDEARANAVSVIRRTRPHVIVCYAQACAQLARWIVEKGLRDWDSIPVICGAEPVLAADRAMLERAFGPVFETYGARETMLIAAECEAHQGMHVSEENLVVEITSGTSPVLAGVSGDVVVTDLHNHGMPLIRYVNGDVAVMSARSCTCGRGLRMVERIEGRRADTLRDAQGNAVPGILLHVIFSDGRTDMLKQFQAVQRASGDVVLRVVRGSGFAREAFDACVARLREHLRGATVTVEILDFIPPAPTGKHRTVVVEPRTVRDAPDESAVTTRSPS